MSKFFRLNAADFFKGLIIAVLGAVIATIQTSVEAGSLNFDWDLIWKYALIAAATYISKNLLSNSEGKFLTKEKK